MDTDDCVTQFSSSFNENLINYKVLWNLHTRSLTRSLTHSFTHSPSDWLIDMYAYIKQKKK